MNREGEEDKEDTRTFPFPKGKTRDLRRVRLDPTGPIIVID